MKIPTKTARHNLRCCLSDLAAVQSALDLADRGDADHNDLIDAMSDAVCAADGIREWSEKLLTAVEDLEALILSD